MFRSDVESNRFGFETYRASSDDVSNLRNTIVKNGADLVILRVNASDTNASKKISQLGFPFMIADTLVYYNVDFKKYTPAVARNSDLVFNLTSPDDDDRIRELVGVIFKNYKNHYHSNDMIPKKGFMLGYKEWAVGYTVNSESKKAWIVKRGNKDIGFCTCDFDTNSKTSEGILYGVLPEAAGGGVYGDMIRFTQQYSKDNGYENMDVSTQVSNFAVQKVWAREGFYMNRVYHTYHINSFLSHSESKAVVTK
jgi:hypothetical protein